MPHQNPAQKLPRLRPRRFGPGFVLESEGPVALEGALGVLLRAAVARSGSIAECAALCGVTVAELRQASRVTRVPLLFPVAVAGEEGGDT